MANIDLSIVDGFSFADPITHLGEYGLDFDGTNDWVAVTSPPSINTIGSYFTVEAWVKIDVIAWKSIVYKREGEEGFSLYILDTPNRLLFLVGGGSFGSYVAIAATTPTTGVWYHLVGTYDNSTIRIYVNGKEDGTYSRAGMSGNAVSDLFIGNNDINTQPFDGIVDEVHFYNRALSANEIRELAAKRKPELDPNTVALWHMDEKGGSGNKVVDASPSRIYGTINGPVYVWAGDKPIPLAIKPDAFTLADRLLRGALIETFLTDAYTLADILTISRVRAISVTDAFAFLDALSAQEAFFRTIVDAYTLADPVTVLKFRVISLSDNYNFADVLATQEIFYRSITDGYSFADASSTQEIFYRALVDAYQLADPITTLKVRLIAISDNYALADIPSVQEVYNRFLTDFYSLADPITALKFKLLGITDGYSLADMYSKQGVYNRLLTDAFTLADALLRGALIEALLTDAYALHDLRYVIKNPIVLEKLIAKLIRLVDLQGR